MALAALELGIPLREKGGDPLVSIGACEDQPEGVLLERVGDLLRVHLIGGHDWYHEGARYLLDHQVADGRWYDVHTHKPINLLNTCFALLFLEKASLAVVTGSD